MSDPRLRRKIGLVRVIRFVILAALTIAVLVPAVVWWGERLGFQMDGWTFSSPPDGTASIAKKAPTVSDFSDALSVNLWRLGVSRPKDHHHDGVSLIVRRGGKIDQRFGGIMRIDDDSERYELMVAVMPIPLGQTFAEADWVGLRCGGSRETILNPFKGKGMIIAQSEPRFWGDEAILMWGHSELVAFGPINSEDRHRSVRDYDVVISLVRTEDGRGPKE